ncbi:2Fe-2S iron-sulfur cluster-binding protein [Emcibacter sp.]|uniref:2Fe-2S iron-sulfur cluster-binding protein n=1 Tax=Emcibacter sp. TaxID=1979954 RepID=UPI002AA6E570|nr:2Fe-2S iron-sulfur cluster-binding protein [Emcibacter sp.]
MLHDKFTITFVDPEGLSYPVKAEEGENLMQVAVTNSIPGIIGECGGAMACATCHIVLDEKDISRFPERSESEEEMLEFAATEKQAGSRLACQLLACPTIDGIVVHVAGE